MGARAACRDIPPRLSRSPRPSASLRDCPVATGARKMDSRLRGNDGMVGAGMTDKRAGITGGRGAGGNPSPPLHPKTNAPNSSAACRDTPPRLSRSPRPSASLRGFSVATGARKMDSCLRGKGTRAHLVLRSAGFALGGFLDSRLRGNDGMGQEYREAPNAEPTLRKTLNGRTRPSRLRGNDGKRGAGMTEWGVWENEKRVRE